VRSSQCCDYFQLAQLASSNTHDKVVTMGFVAVESLSLMLHGGGNFAVGTPECSGNLMSNPGFEVPIRISASVR